MSNNTKIIRNCLLTIQTPSSAITPNAPSNNTQKVITIGSPQPNSIPNPYTVEFDIVRNVTNSTSATFRIYNLSQKTRTSLLRDVKAIGGFQQIVFQAGYGIGTSLPIVFSGYVSQCTSSREGVNVVTTIECYGFAAQDITLQIDGSAISSNNNIAINTLIDNVVTQAGSVGLNKGLVGNFPGTSPTAQTYSGNVVDVINQIVGSSPGVCHIDNNFIHVLSNNMHTVNPTFNQITAATGLLSAPERRNYEITVHILFEPRVVLNQLFTIDSKVNPYLNNRNYKVARIAHKGVISPVISGDATTTLTFFDLVADAPDFQAVKAQ